MAYMKSGALINGVSMATNITGDILEMPKNPRAIVSIQCVAASSTHVGTVAFYGSNDGTNWTPIALLNVDVTAGAALGQARDLVNLGFRFVRPSYTATGGAGSLYVTATVKE